MDFLKEEILTHLPNPKQIILPKYFKATIEDVKNSLNLSDEEIQQGDNELRKYYNALKNREIFSFEGVSIYSKLSRYLAYLNNYLENYYPRLYLVMNHLLRYTKFFEILDTWNERTIEILDIGAGPGTMSFSLIEYLENISKTGAYNFKYCLNVIEQEPNFLNFLQKLSIKIKELNNSINKKIIINGHLTPHSIDFENLEETLERRLKNNTYDIIIISFVLNENSPETNMLKNLFSILLKNLRENSIIIFFEAASDYLYKYFELDFEKEVKMIRVAPCLNGNRIYNNNNSESYPFFCPCGDLCTFQLHSGEINKFCYLVLSKNDILIKAIDKYIKNSINFYRKYKHHLNYTLSQKRSELGESFNILGLFTNRERKNNGYDLYFCNGICKFKLDNVIIPELDIQEGDVITLNKIIYDGLYRKKNKAGGKYIIKNYAEIGFKYVNGISKLEKIKDFHLE